MGIKKIETTKLCRFCDGVGYDLGEAEIHGDTIEAKIIPCNNCNGSGEVKDYYYEITFGNRRFIVDTLK